MWTWLQTWWLPLGSCSSGTNLANALCVHENPSPQTRPHPDSRHIQIGGVYRQPLRWGCLPLRAACPHLGGSDFERTGSPHSPPHPDSRIPSPQTPDCTTCCALRVEACMLPLPCCISPLVAQLKLFRNLCSNVSRFDMGMSTCKHDRMVKTNLKASENNFNSSS